MTRQLVKKPGYMGRAVTAWFTLSFILIAVLALVVWIIGGETAHWYIALPLTLTVVIGEAAIVSNTIGPIVADWVKQEEWKDDQTS